MSGQVYSVTTEGEEALGAATAETLVQVTGAAVTKAKVVAWSVSFDSTSAGASPVVVRFLRQTTAGTATGATETKFDPDSPNANCTSFHSFTAEPTAGEVLETYEVHPQGGSILREYALGREPIIDSTTTSRLGVECNAPAAVNALAWIQWEE